MRRKHGRRTNDEVGIRAVEQPDFKTIQVFLVENIKDMWMFTKCMNI